MEIRNYQKAFLNGIRAAFDKKGDTLRRETYLKGELIDSKNFTGYVSDKQSFALVETEAVFPGGIKAWIKYLSQNLEYPKQAIRMRITGTVIVQFAVSPEGKVIEVEALKSSGNKMLDEEALRLIEKSPNWKPATKNERKEKSYKKQPVVFQFPTQ